MKFEIPKITRAIDLVEYAPEWASLQIHVWVNPPLRLLQEHDQVLSDVRQAVKDNQVEGHSAQSSIEKAADDLARIFSELWSQGPEETHWSAEEVVKLVEETRETDPQLWYWLRDKSIEAIREHRTQIKKD